jgi:hypothetical protein
MINAIEQRDGPIEIGHAIERDVVMWLDRLWQNPIPYNVSRQ